MKKLDYYQRLLGLFLSYKRKKVELKQMPVRLWIEPTNHCNLKCVMCPNKDLKKEDKGFMEFDLFKKIIDEVSEFAFDVHLLHRGESLIHRDFFRMAKYAHDKNLIVKFHTNGTLLDEEKAYKLIESGISQFSFSFDGYDKDTYENIRVNGDFDKTVGNIIRFLEIKKKLKSKKPYTILELINFPDHRIKSNKTQKKEFLNKFKGLPLDRLEIKEFHNWGGEVLGQRNQKNYAPCTFLWHALIIFWDGSVLPCTQDFFGYYILGNVRDSSVKEIWNNEKMLHLREKALHQDIGDLKTCSQCDRVWRDKFLGVPKEYLWKFITKKMP
jgi:radical SAM protein with 4Fe4S-binding SPASM domain